MKLFLAVGIKLIERIGATLSPEALPRIGNDDNAKALLIGASAVFALNNDEVNRLIDDVKESKKKAKDLRPIEEGDIRAGLVRTMSAWSRFAPNTGYSELLQLRTVHAVQRPKAPNFLCSTPPDTSPHFCSAEEQPLAILRKTFADESAMRGWLADNANRDVATWNKKHEPGSTPAWFGGLAAVDLDTTSYLSLSAEFLDVRDDPDLPVTEGRIQFKTITRELFRTTDMSGETPIGAVPNSAFEIIDLVQASTGKLRQLFHSFEDSRARHMQVHYSAISRFPKMLLRPGAPSPSEELFRRHGPKRWVWLPATKRPDPMGKVEILPAFAWAVEDAGRERTRSMRVRFRWRSRKKRDGTREGQWYSSGETEKLGIVLWPPEIFDAGVNNNLKNKVADGKTWTEIEDAKIGPGGAYVTRWGSDAIRDGRTKPDWIMPADVFKENVDQGFAIKRDRQWMPVPAGDGNDGLSKKSDSTPLFQLVSLLCFDPLYDKPNDWWYVDMALNPGAVAGPWVRFGLVRYQEHTLQDRDQPTRDFQVSEPTTTHIRLEPYRRIRVFSRRKRPKDPGWAVEIRVYGPLSVVSGGRDVAEPKIKDEFGKIEMPSFRTELLTGFGKDVYDGLGSDHIGGEVSAKLVTPKTPPDPFPDDEPPADDEIWRSTIWAAEDPVAKPHFVFLEETERMLPASHEGVAEKLAETGPRFAAKVRVQRRT